MFQYITTFNKAFRIAAALLAVIILPSCEKSDDSGPSGFTWRFVPRDCKYLLVQNCEVDSSAYYSTPEKQREELLSKGHQLSTIKRIPLSERQDVKAHHFCMLLNVTSYTEEMAAKLPERIYAPSLLSEADEEMEEIMDEEMRHRRVSTKSGDLPAAQMKYIEYRKEELQSLRIMSSAPIFGSGPGNEITDHFEIFGDENNDFLFNFRKKLLGELERGMSIDEYLSLRPIVSPSLYIHLKSIPEELPMETDLSVEIKLAGGKVLRDTTTVTFTR